MRDPKDPERELALKIFTETEDPDGLVEGLRAAKSLDHRVVLKVLDVGRHEGMPFAVTPRVRGASLAEVMPRLAAQRRPFPAHVVTHLGAEICDFLATASSKATLNGQPKPLIHGHLSPADVFVDLKGRVFVSDVGTPPTESHPAPIGARTVRGKPGYVAPEIVSGREPDSRADLFALGVMLFEGATLKPLFATDGPRATLEAVLKKPTPKLKDVVLGFPESVALVLASLLEKDPANRPANAERARDAFLEAERSLAVRGSSAAESVLAELVSFAMPELTASARPGRNDTVKDSQHQQSTERLNSGVMSGALNEIAHEDRETEMTSPKDVDGPTEAIKTGSSRADGVAPRIERVTLSKRGPSTEAAAANEAEQPKRTPERRASSLSALEPSQVERARRELSVSGARRPDAVIDDEPEEQPHPIVQKIGDALEDPVRQKKIFMGLGAGIVALLVALALMPGSDTHDKVLQSKYDGGDFAAAEAYFVEHYHDFAYPKTAFELAAGAREKKRGMVTMQEAIERIKAEANERALAVDAPKPAEETPDIIVPKDVPDLPEGSSREDRAKFPAAKRLLLQGADAMERGNDADAHKALQDCIQILELPLCHLRLGVLYDRRGEVGKSVRHYRRYLDLSPSAPEREVIEKKLLRAEGRF